MSDPVGEGPGSSLGELITRALAVQKRAYAPYSAFPVGCALITDDGLISEGANVENASYGLTICAERAAIAGAVSRGARSLSCVVIATITSPPATPCGMCLQTMAEFSADPAQLAVVLVNPAGERREVTLAQLLPFGFNKRELPPR